MARITNTTKIDYHIHWYMEELKCTGESCLISKIEYKVMMGINSSNKNMVIHSHVSYESIAKACIS